MQLEKTIHGYEISLDTDTEGAGDNSPERITRCWINKGELSGSLELLLQQGGLENDNGDVVPMPDGLIDRIEGWALVNGY
jgi:hypothetical protein